MQTATRKSARVLQRQTFQTSRLLEYFSEKELTLQTGHEPDRWPEVVVKELVDNALDACEEANISPDINIDIGESSIAVHDNGSGMSATAITGMLDYTVRSSSKDAYISPTRGAQGNALKTILAMPYVLSGQEHGELAILVRNERHKIIVTVDRIAQRPDIRHEVSGGQPVTTGTRIEVFWPDSASSLLNAAVPRFLQIVERYALFNPHATFSLRTATDERLFERTASTCEKWIASEPTSPYWYTVDQLRALAAAYIAAERNGARPRTVREFVAEFRGLSGTAKQKSVLHHAKVSGVHLRDLVRDGDVDRRVITSLLIAMKAESRPVKPTALGVLGEAHLTAWLTRAGAATVTYQKTADIDDESGYPFIVETAFGVRADDCGLRSVIGINWAPTLVDPFRQLNAYGLSLDGLLHRLHLDRAHPVTFVLHLACPHLNYTDRGKSSLEGL